MKLALSRKNLWEKIPPWGKRGLGGVVEWIPAQWLLGARFRRGMAFLRTAQWWSSEQARTYQGHQLQHICRLAYDNSRFYRKLFDTHGCAPNDLRGPEDLVHLPTIDKDTIRENLQDICCTSTGRANIDYVSTGGTGGMPLRFYIGADRSAVEYAHLVMSWARVGYRLTYPLVVLRGQPVGEDRSGLRHEYDPLLRRHYYSNYHMTDENMGRYLNHMMTIGPCFLQVYPSSIATMVRFMRRTGRVVPSNICGILAESEIVYPDDRALAEDVLGVRYFSSYGHTEKLVMAAECEHSADYHVWPTYGIAELLDDEGRPITTPGQRGEIVGTGFINTIVPFIRYRTGDYATYVGDKCVACGREHMVLRDIRGHRTHEILVAVDNTLISWTAINMHDDTFDNVRQFQFAQDRPGEATLRVVPGEDFGNADVQRIRRHLDRKLGDRLRFDIQTTDEIHLTPRGKSTFVDQKIDLDSILGKGTLAV